MYKEICFYGDNFMARSIRDALIRKEDGGLFTKKNFELQANCGSRFSETNQNMISRVVNSFAKGISSNKKLPKYMVIVLDNDLIEYLGYTQFGVSGLLGEWIDYLAKTLDAYVTEKKAQLPSKPVKRDWPLVYWVQAPHHRWFTDNPLQSKFNNTLDATPKLYKNMHFVKIKNVWDYDDNMLVNPNGSIMTVGLFKYWEAIDTSLEFNVLKHESFTKRDQRSAYALSDRSQ